MIWGYIDNLLMFDRIWITNFLSPPLHPVIFKHAREYVSYNEYLHASTTQSKSWMMNSDVFIYVYLRASLWCSIPLCPKGSFHYIELFLIHLVLKKKVLLHRYVSLNNIVSSIKQYHLICNIVSFALFFTMVPKMHSYYWA